MFNFMRLMYYIGVFHMCWFVIWDHLGCFSQCYSGWHCGHEICQILIETPSQSVSTEIVHGVRSPQTPFEAHRPVFMAALWPHIGSFALVFCSVCVFLRLVYVWGFQAYTLDLKLWCPNQDGDRESSVEVSGHFGPSVRQSSSLKPSETHLLRWQDPSA